MSRRRPWRRTRQPSANNSRLFVDSGFWMALRKTPAGFLRRGLNSSRLRCYFLQHPVLQHSLPLQHACLDAVAAVAVPIKARRLRINKKYFINSSFEFSNGIRHAMFSRAEPSLKRKAHAAAAPADVGSEQSDARFAWKSRRSSMFARKTDLNFRNKETSKQPARCNTSLSSASLNRD